MSGSPSRDGGRLPYAGVELGGTKCVCTLAHGPGEVLDQRTIPTTTPRETLPAIVATLEEWHGSTGFAALGIASFGPLDLDPRSEKFGQVRATNKPDWPGADVLGTISAPFDVPVGFDTDVNGAALAEIAWGAGQGLDDFAYVTVGTGVGVGLVVHGKPTRGIGHSEIGHVRVPRLAGDTFEGVCRYHPDCVEGLASGTALKARVGARHVGDIAPDDPVWEPIVHTLSAMVHDLVCVTGPLKVAMGGGVIARQPHLIERVNKGVIASLGGYMPLPQDGPYVVAPQLGAMAGPLGAIALAMAAEKAAT